MSDIPIRPAIAESNVLHKRNFTSTSALLLPEQQTRTSVHSVGHEKEKIQRTDQAASLISTALPDELLMEILSRLPPKPFFRCKTICKSWLSLCSAALCHNKYLKPTMTGLFYNRINMRYDEVAAGFVNLPGADVNLSVVPRLSQFNIIDCCNGILLLEEWHYREIVVKGMCIYNPATQTRLNLDSYTKLTPKWCHFSLFSLAFDPCVPYLFHLIRFSALINGVPYIEFFSLKRGRFKCKHEQVLAYDMMVSSSSKSTFVDGRVHLHTSLNEILSIDPKNCTFELIHRRYLKGDGLVDEIGKCRGLLHCMYGRDIHEMSIWVYSYVQREWTLQHQINLYKIMKSIGIPHIQILVSFSRMHNLGQFAFHEEKNVIFMPLKWNAFFSLDLNSGKTEQLGTLSFDSGLRWWVYMPCYFV